MTQALSISYFTMKEPKTYRALTEATQQRMLSQTVSNPVLLINDSFILPSMKQNRKTLGTSPLASAYTSKSDFSWACINTST